MGEILLIGFVQFVLFDWLSQVPLDNLPAVLRPLWARVGVLAVGCIGITGSLVLVGQATAAGRRFLLMLYYNLGLRGLHLLGRVWPWAAGQVAKKVDGDDDLGGIGLILDSFEAQLDRRGRAWKKPVVVQRRHLDFSDTWPNWAFSIVLLANELQLDRRLDSDGSERTRLTVNLRGQSTGLYNNAGKRWLRARFHKELRRYEAVSHVLAQFLKTAQAGSEHKVPLESLPLRWASGGVVPVVRWRGQRWITVFFRDIAPIGWNIANGASETKAEYKNLESLICREFAEECVVLASRPYTKGRSRQLEVRMSSCLADAMSKRAITKHREVRRRQDDITLLPPGPQDILIAREIPTTTEVRVIYEDPLGRPTERTIRDVYFNVNPAEMGIEVVRLVEFELPDEAVIIDGELLENLDMLVRRPVGLIREDYLRRTLGDSTGRAIIVGGESAECLDLKRIPADAFHLLEPSLELRRERLSRLGGSKGRESEALSEWYARFGRPFERLESTHEGLDQASFPEATRLCPVTWKTLEAWFRDARRGQEAPGKRQAGA